MSGWYYIKSGMLDRKTIGPISGEELLRMAYEGSLTADTQVSHEKHTNNNLVALSKVPAARKRIEKGVADRQKQKEKEKKQKQADNLKKRKKQSEERRKQSNKKLSEKRPCHLHSF